MMRAARPAYQQASMDRFHETQSRVQIFLIGVCSGAIPVLWWLR